MIICNECIHFGVCMGFNKCKRFERRENATVRITGYEVDGGKLSAVYITDETRGIEQKKYVEDRPHGKWMKEIIVEEPRKNKRAYARCTVCGVRFNHYKFAVLHFDFCPKCGARMQKEGEAE